MESNIGFIGLLVLYLLIQLKSEEVKKLKKVIEENKKEEKKVEKQIKELEKAKTASKKELVISKKKTYYI